MQTTNSDNRVYLIMNNDDFPNNERKRKIVAVLACDDNHRQRTVDMTEAADLDSWQRLDVSTDRTTAYVHYEEGVGWTILDDCGEPFSSVVFGRELGPDDEREATGQARMWLQGLEFGLRRGFSHGKDETQRSIRAVLGIQ